MPVIGTSGSLAIVKALNVGAPVKYWILQLNDADYLIQNLVITDNNQIISTSYNSSTTNKIYVIKTNQATGLPIITQETNVVSPKTFMQDGPITIADNKVFAAPHFDIPFGLGGNSSAGTLITSIDLNVQDYYDDSANVFGPTGNSVNYRRAWSILANSVSDYWIAGVINERSNANANLFKAYLTNFNSNTKVTTKVFSDPQPASQGIFSQMKYTDDGNIVLFTSYGTANSVNQFTSVYKYDVANGNIAWENRYPRANTQQINGSVIDGKDGYIYATFAVGFNANATNQGLYLYKYNANNGSTIFSKKLSNSSGFANSRISTNYTGNIYLGVYNAGGAPRLQYIIDLDTNGNINYQRSISNVNDLYGCEYKNQNLYLIGDARSPTGNVTTRSATYLKLPADGTILGTGTYNVHANLSIVYSNSNVFTSNTGSIATVLPTSFTVGNAISTPYITLTPSVNSSILTTTYIDIT